MTVGKKVDEFTKQRDRVRKAEEKAKAEREKLDRLKSDLLHEMEAEGLEQAAGHNGVAYIKKTTLYTLKDREAFDKFVRRHNAFELYQARVSQTALRERIESTKRIPAGLGTFDKVDVNVRGKR